MAGVPRVFLKFYQSIWDAVGKYGCVKKWFIGKAYAYQCNQLREVRPSFALKTKISTLALNQDYIHKKIPIHHTILRFYLNQYSPFIPTLMFLVANVASQGKPLDPSYDTKVFSLMRTKIGLERCRVFITGASPCPPYLVEFMRVMTAAWFAQGYGMTEGSAGSSVSLQSDPHVGECGPPLPCNEFKLSDIPDMGYLSSNPVQTGELLISGPNVFQVRSILTLSTQKMASLTVEYYIAVF